MMKLRRARRSLRFDVFAASTLGLWLASTTATAATWTGQRTTPHIRDLVAVDRTGEPGWIFGPEDVADDGLGMFTVEEQAIDLRTAYMATAEGRLFLRTYVSGEAAPDETLRVYVFIDRDENPNTGGDAVAPEIDPTFTLDVSDGGYDYVIAMQAGTEVGGVWEWRRQTEQFEPMALPPLAAVAESGTDLDPLRLFADVHGYLQVALDAPQLGITPSCDANVFIRSTTTDGGGDIDLGELARCIARDDDRNAVADIIEDDSVDAGCDDDDQCPASALCIQGVCRYPGYCRSDADCGDDESCDANDVCRARDSGTCSAETACAGGLVCVDDSTCRACTSDAACEDGERCAASGRCVDDDSPNGASTGTGPGPGIPLVSLSTGQEIQGGAGACGLTPGSKPRPWLAILAVLAAAAAFMLVRRRRRVLLPGIALCFASSESHAEVDAERLKPALTHDGWINAEGSAVRHPDDPWQFGASLSYAVNPLIIADSDDELVEAVVAGRAGLDLLGSVSFSRRLAVGVGLPVFGQHGYASPSSFGIGDLRLMPKLELASDLEDGIGFALAAEVRAPTHTGDYSGGARSFQFFPKAILDHRFRNGLRIGANAGVILREDQNLFNATHGDELAYAAAIGYRFGGLSGKTEVGLELAGGVNLSDPGDEEVALEALGFLRHAVSAEWQVHGGAGAGVLDGYGVPTVRVFFGVTFTPTSHDRDYDGVTDSEDECQEFAEDRDGVLDMDGCPEEDPDADHDGVSDYEDRCPADKETINGIEDDDGCPDSGDRRVIFRDGEFFILDTIRFETGSSEVHPEAYSLLNQVALTMRANPEIEHIRVEGHTDDTGPREINMQLSHQRALAVKRYLVQRGVSPKRLSIRSYGPDKPRQAGTDSDARAKNRRVEFIVE